MDVTCLQLQILSIATAASGILWAMVVSARAMVVLVTSMLRLGRRPTARLRSQRWLDVAIGV